MRVHQLHYNFKLELDRVASNDRPDLMPWEIDEYLNKAIFKFIKTRYSYNEVSKLGFETTQKRIDELSSLHIKSPEVQPPIIPLNLGNGRYELNLNLLGNNLNGQHYRYLFLTKAFVTIRKGNCVKTIDNYMWQIDDVKTRFNCPSWNWSRVHANFGKSSFITVPDLNPNISDSMDYTANIITGSGVNERYNNDNLVSLFFDTTNKKGVQEFEIDSVAVSYIKYPNRVFFGGYDHIDLHSTSTSSPIHSDLSDAFQDEIVRLAVSMCQENIQDMNGVQISNQKIVDDYQL